MLVLAVAACSGGTEPKKVCTVSSVSVSPGNTSANIGASQQLTATVNATDCAATPTASWTSSAIGIATVNTNGMVTGVSVGSATITATAGGKTANADVTITPIPVATVSITPPPKTGIVINETLQLAAVTRDAGGNALSGRVITWSSSASGVATVGASSGLVTGVAVGSTNITATSEGATSTALSITVSPIPVATVAVNPSAPSVAVGGTQNFAGVTRDASNTVLTGRVVTWESLTPAVATINATTGVATAITPGTSTIRATSEGKQGTTTLTVTAVALGYVYASSPSTNGYNAAGFNGAAGTTLVNRPTLGNYVLTFNGLGTNIAPSWTTTVSAVNGFDNASLVVAPSVCNPTNLVVSATTVVLSISCVNTPNGASMDSRYRAMVVGSNVLGGTGAGGRAAAFSTHNQLSAATTYSSPGLYAWNTAGTAIQIVKTAGSNDVKHNMGITFPTGISRIVTGFGSGVECSTTSYFATGIGVFCFDMVTGNEVNTTHMALAVAGGRPSKAAAYVQIYNGGSTTPTVFPNFTTGSSNPTITRTAVGKYTMTFPGITAVSLEDVSVSITTQLDLAQWNQCTHSNRTLSPLAIDISCINRAGAFTDSWGFGVLVIQ
jgi:trimeric autotransporter adhesin